MIPDSLYPRVCGAALAEDGEVWPYHKMCKPALRDVAITRKNAVRSSDDAERILAAQAGSTAAVHGSWLFVTTVFTVTVVHGVHGDNSFHGSRCFCHFL